MSGENRKEVLRNVYIVWGFFLFLAVAVIAKICYIAFVQGNYYKQKGRELYVKERTIEANRGNIYADDMSLLATSLPFFDVRFDPLASDQYYREMKEKTRKSEWPKYDIFNKNIDSLSICISKYLMPGLTPKQVKKWLTIKRKKQQRYLLLATDIPYEKMLQVKKFPLFRLSPNKSGLIMEQKSRRVMPYGDLALRTIGYTSDNSQPIGLEGYYNKSLKGEVGKRLMQFIKPNAWIPINDLTEIEPRNGQDILTTLNVQLQDITTTALREALIYNNAANGCAIVMEVKTGAIKAISNLSKSGDKYVENYNLAIAHSIEPGSTFKLASLMAIMEDNKLKLTDSVDVNYGKAMVSGHEMKDSEAHQYKWVSLQRAFEISSNIGISKAVVKAYGQQKNDAYEFINRLKQFHLDKVTGIDLEGEPKPLIKEPYNLKQLWSRSSLAWIAHGYESQLTPLQMLTFYNAVANNGKMMRPYLVSEIQSQGYTDRMIQPQVLVDKIASDSTIARARRLLEGVVLRGTAKSQRTELYTFAGKTGTSVLDYGGAKTGRYRASFIGYFPADNPVYSCIVMVTEPHGHGFYGAEVALPVFRQIADKAMSFDPHFFHEIQSNEIASSDSPFLPVGERGNKIDYISVLTRLGITASTSGDQGNWVYTQMKNNAVDLLAYTQSNNLVPDVRGMGLRDALYSLESKGLSAEVSGNGRVSQQNINPGTKVSGQRVLLTLK